MATILIVEDEDLVRELYGAWLEESGHDTKTASSVQEALAILQHTDVDTIVSDIRMTQNTGIDLLAWVHKRDETLPVILVTGVPAVETAIEALRLQAYDYLVKPISESALRRSVNRAVEHRRLRAEKARLEVENQRYREHLEQLVEERTRALERRNRHLTVLHRISQDIGALQEMTTLFQKVVHLVQNEFDYMRVSIYKVDLLIGKLQLAAVAAREHVEVPNADFTQPIQVGLLGRAARENRAIIAQDVSDWPEFIACTGDPAQAEAIFPIYDQNDLVALLNIDADRTHAFDETDNMVLHTLARYVSIAVSNARLYEEAQDALRAREEMLNNVSHELRTPLTIIRGYAELVTEGLVGDLNEDLAAVAGTILDQAKHLSHLVDQLVAFRRVEREGITMEPVPFGDWLRHVLSTWTPMMREHGLTLEWQVPQRLGIIQGNTNYLTEIMNNLLDNARKFSPPGTTVFVQAHRNGPRIYVSVQDQGIGVSREKLDRIFERFYQADGGINRRFSGMGLGLALVQEIITRHGGEVWAESEGEGKGLTITFTLPVYREEEALM